MFFAFSDMRKTEAWPICSRVTRSCIGEFLATVSISLSNSARPEAALVFMDPGDNALTRIFLAQSPLQDSARWPQPDCKKSKPDNLATRSNGTLYYKCKNCNYFETMESFTKAFHSSEISQNQARSTLLLLITVVKSLRT